MIKHAFPSGTTSGGFLDVIRSKPGNLHDSIYMFVRASILVNGVGMYVLTWRGHIAFLGTAGVAVIAETNTITATTAAINIAYPASRISLGVSSQGSDRARFTLSLTSAPNTSALTADAVITGSEAYLASL